MFSLNCNFSVPLISKILKFVSSFICLRLIVCYIVAEQTMLMNRALEQIHKCRDIWNLLKETGMVGIGSLEIQ